ncbi:Mmo1p SKDI_11G1680 [Saccharomyces kudriavzevii IFO 1802]|uniref:Transmembrane protein n=1 Tax=Saccharomyces kudriavzevii (strain ATCC MYA-4449 / AS 2.2408 / CBS 8840 / NBRC 1802 / NCYC 2889) TaxID=226230 RepID=A0AA35J0Y3_SACK1|nr:uncharacterized protein SKDI_11G1680 [Saccharomyces kudriavzevii IFO 1802]CAI4044869.1 hypothetical protein SKDI_11G1680 [Saccharomyces kudriavzevii IFO 1802]
MSVARQRRQNQAQKWLRNYDVFEREDLGKENGNCIYIYIYGCIYLACRMFFLHIFLSFFFFFRLQTKTAILSHNPPLYFSFFIFDRNSLQLEQSVISIKQSLPSYIPPLSS